MKKILLTAGFTLFAWGSTCLAQSTYFSDSKEWLRKAEACKPELSYQTISPVKVVRSVQDTKAFQGWRMEDAGQPDILFNEPFKKHPAITLDFGNHYTGYLTFSIKPSGLKAADAPVRLKFTFAEVPGELNTPLEPYKGGLARSWVQDEIVTVMSVPHEMTIPRRLAGRYLKIELLGISGSFDFVFDKLTFKTQTSVTNEAPALASTTDPLVRDIYKVGLNTLKECMQDVFEDGPKRDRRMWLGDLRLQARANYYTFKNYDLAKRCMYIFAGLLFNEGKLSACVFTEPEMEPDDTYLLDYALFFSSVLLDYYEATDDLETLRDLYDVAIDQIRIAMTQLNEKNVVEDLGDAFWCFLDWGDGLNKQAGATAVLIYCIRYGIRLAKILDKQEDISWLEEKQAMLKEAAVKEFWDEELGMFVSGPDRQASWATQIWMILARVFDKETNCKLIHHVMEVNPRIRMVTPYMYHHYIDALIRCDEKELALEEMKRYWGEMIHDGADTFWELYNPYNREESPYGSSMVNSYCHAWSCTPTYFLRKFYMDNEK